MICIALKNNKIIHRCETDSKQNVIASMQYDGITEYDTIEVVPNEYFQGKVGDDVREFDSNYEFLPLSKRKDYVIIPEGMKIEGDEFVAMTTKEKIDTGLIKLSDREKYDKETERVRTKTLDELLSNEVITKEVWYDTKLAECLNQRKYAYMSEADPLKNELEYDGKDSQIWKDKVKEIKVRYPKPTKS